MQSFLNSFSYRFEKKKKMVKLHAVLRRIRTITDRDPAVTISFAFGTVGVALSFLALLRKDKREIYYPQE